jgi:subtilisin family serine protease
VKVTAASGAGVSGAVVTFAVSAGSGNVAPPSATTDANGQASATWTLGPKAGTNNDTATASVSGLGPVIFVASAKAQSPTQIASSGGNGDTALAGTTLPTALSVLVRDPYGNPFPGFFVAWAMVTGSGSLSPPSSQTGANGIATTQLTLGREPGVQTVSATAPGLTGSPVTFSEIAVPNATISGTITVTSSMLAPPARLVAPRPQVRGRALLLPAGTSPFFVRRELPSLARTVPTGTLAPAFAPTDLIVTLRHTALNTPPPGSVALASLATTQSVGALVRSHLATVVPAGARVAGVSPTILAAKIEVADSTALDAVAAQLRRDPAVATVERNRLVWLDRTRSAAASTPTIPNDSLYRLQSWHYGLIDLPRAWSVTTGSASVLVAVVDQGIRFDHPDLAANLTSDGYDFVSNVSVPLCGGGSISNDDDGDSGYDPDPTQPDNFAYDPKKGCATPEPIGGHGVHVSGTIGAVGNNSGGVTGVNWAVKIRSVRVIGVAGVGSAYDISQGILYAAGLPADNGSGSTVKPATAARIINLSLGSTSSDTTMHLAVIAAANAGVLVVAAAGNSATTAPSYPAAYPEVLAVSAVGPGATLSFYSNYGSDIGIAAPGGDESVGDSSDGVFSTLWNFGTSAPTYGAFQGTSMASPHVVGVAALVLAQTPSLTASQLRSRLTSYAVNIGPSLQYGAGLVNAYNSLTQSLGPPAQLYAQLYNQANGAIVQTVQTQAGGAYTFTGLPDGTYSVYGGTDESADRLIGVPGRRWGAFGGSALPSGVAVAGAGNYPASFSIGFPVEADPNNTIATANVLMVGGYMEGKIVNPSPSVPDDIYRVVIPQAGTYTFETSGWVGACGFALEENTILGLYGASGTLITTNDDIDAVHYNFCSRITASLTAGTYYLGVAGYYGRRYRVQARSGS